MNFRVILILLILSIQCGAQNFSFVESTLSKIQNKELVQQIRRHEQIKSEIFDILNAKTTAEAFHDKKCSNYASTLRKEQNEATNILYDAHSCRLSKKDSVFLNLIKQDSLLAEKFKKFNKSFLLGFPMKVSKSDDELQRKYYHELITEIDKKYENFFQTKDLKSKSTLKKQIFDSEMRLETPLHPKCVEMNADYESRTKCFSAQIREQLTLNSDVPDYLDYGTIMRGRLLVKVEKDGRFKAVEVVKSTGSYFLDMQSMCTANELFSGIVLKVSDVYYGQLPITYNFEY